MATSPARVLDWKLKLMQILRCFSENEGTWYEGEWECYGITYEERKQLEEEYSKWLYETT